MLCSEVGRCHTGLHTGPFDLDGSGTGYQSIDDNRSRGAKLVPPGYDCLPGVSLGRVTQVVFVTQDVIQVVCVT